MKPHKPLKAMLSSHGCAHALINVTVMSASKQGMCDCFRCSGRGQTLLTTGKQLPNNNYTIKKRAEGNWKHRFDAFQVCVMSHRWAEQSLPTETRVLSLSQETQLTAESWCASVQTSKKYHNQPTTTITTAAAWWSTITFCSLCGRDMHYESSQRQYRMEQIHCKDEHSNLRKLITSQANGGNFIFSPVSESPPQDDHKRSNWAYQAFKTKYLPGQSHPIYYASEL